MSVMALVALDVAEGKADAMVAVLRDLLPETRTFDGCLSVAISTRPGEPNKVVLHEQWESSDKHQAYMAWRTENGSIQRIAELLAGPPDISYFDVISG